MNQAARNEASVRLHANAGVLEFRALQIRRLIEDAGTDGVFLIADLEKHLRIANEAVRDLQVDLHRVDVFQRKTGE